ncbi:hypothetical protein [Nitrosomonas sp. sh817]
MLVEQALQRSPCAGSAFVFCNRTGNHIRVRSSKPHAGS